MQAQKWNENRDAETEVGTYRPDLRPAENRDVEKRVAPRAAVVYETIRREGEDELDRPASALAWSGLAAGLSMGFSLVAQGLLVAHLPEAPWTPLISKMGYALGFLIVILGRQQLFTENTVRAIIPVLSDPRRSTMGKAARLWAIVLVTNLLGAAIFAWILANTDVFDGNTRSAFSEIGREALQGSFGRILLEGVFAGWLIALMVWLLPGAETARVSIIILITYMVGLGGLAHIIAGSVDVLFSVMAGEVTAWDYLGGFMIPTLLGNILGGVALVSILNYAQVAAGDRAHTGP